MRRTAGPLAAAAVVAAGLPLEELWLGADDECSPAAGSEQPCELSALQLRGARLAERGLYMGRDLVADEGEEIGYRADVDAKDCERACDDLAGCRSFTYGFRGPEWGKCFLKDMPVSQESATTTNTWKRDRYRTYYKLQAAGGYMPRVLVRDEGKQLATQPNASPEQCAELCDQTPRCHSFTYSLGGDDIDSCYLKDGRPSGADASSTEAWNRERYITYYKMSAGSAGADRSEFYEKAAACRPGAIIRSLAACRAAAEDLGVLPPQPRPLPADRGAALPPGCLFGEAGDGAPGVLFNEPYALDGMAARATVRADAGVQLLCKRKPFMLHVPNKQCIEGTTIRSLAECEEAADWLGLAAPREVSSMNAFVSPTGCYEMHGLVWYNAAASFGALGGASRHLCRSEALGRGL